MKSLWIVFIGLAGWSSTQAQTGSIHGKVLDAISEKPMEYAMITIKSSSDSSMVTGGMTDSTGLFVLEPIPYGDYFAEMSFIGYETINYPNIKVNTSTPIVLETISLSVSNQLQGVDIEVEKAALENRLDKKVFNASESEIAAGGTGLDLMRTVPMVTVDENDNILLRGDGNVTLFINGRPSAIPVNELLKQIPSTSIEKIELITNPSAKYDPEGMSGIINVILKKEKREGFNASLNASAGYGKFYKTNNSTTFNYRNDKLNLNGTVGYSDRKIWFGGSLDRDVLLADDSWDILRQEDYGERINTGLSTSLGMDYFLNDKNTVYVNGSWSHRENDGSRLVEYNNQNEEGNLTAYSEREGRIDVPSDAYSLNFGWQKTFQKPDHTLDLDFNQSTFDMVADERLVHDYYSSAMSPLNTAYQNTLNDNVFTNRLAKLDYTLPINDSLMIEAGFHYTNRYSNNDYYSESGSNLDSLTPDLAINNTFEYDQKVYAGYATMSKDIKKVGLKLGVRAEQTYTDAVLLTTSDRHTNDYFMLFPSAYFSYNINDMSSVQLSYSRRINRPEEQQLNPFSNYSDPLVLQSGNPFLLPETIHVNELSYMKYWKKFNVNATVYARFLSNMIRRNLSYEGTQSVVSYSNLGQSTLTGSDLIMTYTPNKVFRIMCTTNFWNTNTSDEELTGGQTVNLSGINTSLMVSARLQNQWSMQLWGSYSPRQQVLQGAIIPNYGTGLSIGKQVLKGKGRFTLSIYDLFKTRRFGFEGTELADYRFNSYRNWESRSVYLSFNYNVGKMIQGKQKREIKSNDSSDDVSVPEM